ncbi:hypothetical protein [Methylorubrum sp. GM97]|uniref:hypothetical protein n=1 Tax=Methylorubrum sp. GM97 TaxID=2938232 RepID=UPI0021C37872|nr:hypothetical protein [Methylorubrum sp. GM97]
MVAVFVAVIVDVLGAVAVLVGAVVVVVLVAVGESRLVVTDDRAEIVPLMVEDTAAVVP